MIETERLSKHILDLQKDKGDLTDENKVLKQNLEDSEIVNKSLTDRVANLEYLLEGRDNEIKELKAQIEKMKCCENCKYNSYWGNELHCNYGLKEALQEDKLVECENMDKWEIKEND